MGTAGLNLLKSFEGLVIHPYDDADTSWPRKMILEGDPVRGVLTIGYGHTGPDVKPGKLITPSEAESLLRRDISRSERAVSKYVKVSIRQNQFDAMVSLAFNIGVDAFRLSTVLRKLNNGDDYGAADAFLLWKKVTINGSHVDSAGLLRRRKAERELFLRN